MNDMPSPVSAPNTVNINPQQTMTHRHKIKMLPEIVIIRSFTAHSSTHLNRRRPLTNLDFNIHFFMDHPLTIESVGFFLAGIKSSQDNGLNVEG